MADLKLYIGSYCPFCIKVKNFINKNNIQGIEYVNINKDEKAKEHLIEVGGKKQIPCLMIDDKPLYESRDIIEYLKENCMPK